MTQEQGNKIIAEFIGDVKWKPVKAGFENGGSHTYMDVYFDTQEACLEYCNTINEGKHPDYCYFPLPDVRDFELLYHSSWDWLIPACHKWDNLTDAEIIEGTWPEYERLSDILDAKITLYEILPVWEQLVKNLQWYNNNQTTQS